MKRPGSISFSVLPVIETTLLVASAIFLILHAFHLSADFPNHSPWMDWAKYTDEGWYGDGAIRHFQRGHWNVPGDFNPAAALPVWPLVEAALFRFTGVNLIAARSLAVAIFGLILTSSYLLLRRWQTLTASVRKQPVNTLAPAIAVLLLAVSPFCYVFTRMAILEPLLILLTLLALLAASFAETVQGSVSTALKTDPATALRATARQILPILALGLLIPLMVLTKTTAVFLLPSIGWILWARAGYRLRPFLMVTLPAATLAAVIWIGYYAFIVRPHFLDDYRYLFSANAYTGITPGTALSVLGDTLADGLWIGNILYPLALLAIFSAFLLRPRLLRNPLVPALLLWAAGYAAFLAYHNNLQPRYYLVLAVPLTLLIPVVFSALWTKNNSEPLSPLRRLGTSSIVAVLAVLTVTDAHQTLHYVRHPDYTFTTAAAEIRQIVSADPTHNSLILSISGSNLSLMTGLPSICDDFGTMDLSVRVQAYHPGWYVAWNQVDDDKMDALSPTYHLQRIAAFPAMDDPERNLLILYRLDPATSGANPRRHRKPVIPRLLQTSFGQQPSPAQLQH
ncbi:hypothetical protein [Granulicella sp. S190]|uniref:hypothetical protein n=1 Tax=Granulicella sp. S190 TaxID=1747226 RepID=UPI00131BB9A2|nr:hypothetical protein [Granulicella sp. S190]